MNGHPSIIIYSLRPSTFCGCLCASSFYIIRGVLIATTSVSAVALSC